MIGIITTTITTIIAGVIGFVLQQKIKENKLLKQEREKLKTQHEIAIENGILCILRKHLMDEHDYWTKKGYITPTALESGLAMYKAYKMLGGNGMIDHMEEEIQALPIRD